MFDPDYNSKSGESVRIVGYSLSADAVITVITVEKDGIVYGASAWKSNAKDRRYYENRGAE